MTQLFMRSRTVEIDLYDVCKYTAKAEDFERERRIRYEYCTGFEVISGKDYREQEMIKEIEGQGLVDDLHEYLVLFFEDGETATFRNSYCDMFAF